MAQIMGALVALLLAGCGMAQQMQISQEANDAQAKRDLALSACQERHPSKAVDRIKCSNAADLEYHLAMERSVGHPGMDLIHLSHAKRLALAEKYDAGKLTEAEYKLAVAQSASEVNSQLHARINNAAVAQAAQSQAAAAQQQAAAQTMATGAAIMTGGLSGQAPSPSTTSCRKLGNTVHCSHF